MIRAQVPLLRSKDPGTNRKMRIRSIQWNKKGQETADVVFRHKVSFDMIAEIGNKVHSKSNNRLCRDQVRGSVSFSIVLSLKRNKINAFSFTNN